MNRSFISYFVRPHRVCGEKNGIWADKNHMPYGDVFVLRCYNKNCYEKGDYIKWRYNAMGKWNQDNGGNSLFRKSAIFIYLSLLHSHNWLAFLGFIGFVIVVIKFILS